MKKFLVLLAALLFAAACAAPTSNVNTPIANTNAAKEAAPALTEADAIAKEKGAWSAIQNKDYVAFGDMLAPEAIEVSSEKVFDKAGTMEDIKDFEPSQVDFSDWKFLQLDKDAFVVTYSVKINGKYKGQTIPTANGRASSAWVSRDGKWVSIYHQETMVKPPMPPPPASKNATAHASPSPATAAPAATPGSDVAADEQMVWDALKSKNYDAFASMLAADSIEVEPDGVFDKAGSVKGVQNFDASKAVVSDFKVVRMDDDASIVTYLVKIPGMAPNGERHSTIWTNTDGRWQARFHQGTPIEAMPAAGASPKATPSPHASSSPRTAASPQ